MLVKSNDHKFYTLEQYFFSFKSKNMVKIKSWHLATAILVTAITAIHLAKAWKEYERA